MTLSLDPGSSSLNSSSSITASLLGTLSLDETWTEELGPPLGPRQGQPFPEPPPPSWLPEAPTDVGEPVTSDEPGPGGTVTLGASVDGPTALTAGDEAAPVVLLPSWSPSVEPSEEEAPSRGEPEPAPVEEDTEALETPVPLPIRVALIDEPLPFPALLVRPTIVLPGAWPPPFAPRSENSEPSGVRDFTLPTALEELALDPAPEDASDLLLDSAEPGRSDEVSLIIDDSMAEVSIEEDGRADASEPSGARAIRSDEPPVRGTLDEIPVMKRSRPIAPPDADDDIPTEVSQKDALEAALVALRVAEPAALGPATDDRPYRVEDAPDDAAGTSDDLVSLELVHPSDHQRVDASVLADLVAAERWTRRPLAPERVLLEVGTPTLASAPGPRVFVSLTLLLAAPAAPERPPHPSILGPNADDSIEALLVLRDDGAEPAILSLDSISDQPAPRALAPPSHIEVDLGLGTAAAPDRESARKGVAVAPPRPVRAREGGPPGTSAERRTDLVALARGIDPVAAPPPLATVDEDDDWLAEVLESAAPAAEALPAPSAQSPAAPPSAVAPMSPHYEDTLPGWLPEARGAPRSATRGGPDQRRPPTLAPLPKSPFDEDDGAG